MSERIRRRREIKWEINWICSHVYTIEIHGNIDKNEVMREFERFIEESEKDEIEENILCPYWNLKQIRDGLYEVSIRGKINIKNMVQTVIYNAMENERKCQLEYKMLLEQKKRHREIEATKPQPSRNKKEGNSIKLEDLLISEDDWEEVPVPSRKNPARTVPHDKPLTEEEERLKVLLENFHLTEPTPHINRQQQDADMMRDHLKRHRPN